MSYSKRSRYSASPPPSGRYGRSVSRSRSTRSRSRSPSCDVENPGNNLYVTGLSPRITKRELGKHFAAEGKVIDVHLVVDPWTRESRGFGFVTMSTNGEADRCIKYLNRSVLEGRVITVEKAKRRRGRTPTPGRYLGLRTIRLRHSSRSSSPHRRSPSYSPYSRSQSRSPQYSSERSRSRSYSPYNSRRRPYSPDHHRRRSFSPYDYGRRRSYSPSRSPYGRGHSRGCDRSYRRRSYSRSRSAGIRPPYGRHDREYSPDDSRYYSPDDRYYRRHRYRSVSRSPTPPRSRSYRRSYSRSISPSPRRGFRRSMWSYSPSITPSPRRTLRSYSRSISPKLRKRSRRSTSHGSSRGSYSRSRSVSPRSRSVSRSASSRSSSPSS